ncbi:MAG: hypothetical protein N2484_13460 [Clostridia bacterium]|nr:hypothetical protein [Clostridia bacterium]
MDHEMRPEEQAVDSQKENQEANARRIEALLELNNRYVRTQRHLEQHSDITRLENLKHSLKIQEEREARMENLKNIITQGKHNEVDEKANLKRNLEFTEHYLQHHSAHMDQFSLEKTTEKQEHRREQLKFMD